MKKTKSILFKTILFALFLIFTGISFLIKFAPGIAIAKNFGLFSFQMIKVLPAVFILIGLFDVWIKKETIVKHLGEGGGIKSFVWMFLLAAPMAGGLLPAFPVAYTLYKKGARFTVVLTFLGAVGIARAPMVFFESAFLGWRFSIIRIIASIPLVVLTAITLGKALEKSGYTLPQRD